MNNKPVAWMSSVGGEFVYVGYEPAEGLLRAGADADFPVMFAEAIIEFYELRKAQDK